MNGMKDISTASGAIPAVFRDINVVTTEIRTLQASAKRIAIEYAIEVGKRLTEAKEMLGHGEWAGWLEDEVNFSQDTANRMMKIYAERDTISNSATLRNLSISNALKLLALPEADREEVINNNDVESLSARELEKVIKERDALIAVKKALESDNSMLRKSNTELNMKAAEAAKAAGDTGYLKQSNEDLKKQLGMVSKETEKLRQSESEAKQKALEAREELEALKKAPREISAEDAERISSEATAAAEKEFGEKLKRLEQDAEAAKAESEQLRKQLAQADSEVTVFKTYFEQVQDDFQKLGCSLTKIKAGSPETAEKLSKAIRALLENFGSLI